MNIVTISDNSAFSEGLNSENVVLGDTKCRDIEVIKLHRHRAYDNSQSSDIFWSFDRSNQTNLLYIINGKVNESITEKQMSRYYLFFII